ncbi:amidohydrolase family protein [Candidatus Uhrbacteria bacterium]|nr:amidohydrolase family protein [Candidatus Uhrbacteria bacterium]
MIIDIHTHLYEEATYAQYRAQAGDRVRMIFTIYHWSTHDAADQVLPVDFDRVHAFVRSHPDMRLIPAFDMNAAAEPQLERLHVLFADRAVVGVKCYPGYQHVYPSDERLVPLAQLCAEFRKPLIFHCGDVYDIEQQAMLLYSHPIHVDVLAMRVPACPMVIAHFGFPYLLETANVVSKNANVYTDCSGTIDSVGGADRIRPLVQQYARDLDRAFAYFPDVRQKMMFGTDYAGMHTGLHEFDPYVALVEQVFAPAERPWVFSGLAETLFLHS